MLQNCATGILAARAIRCSFNSVTLTQCDLPLSLVDTSYPVSLDHVFNDLTCDTAVVVDTRAQFSLIKNSSIFRLAGSRLTGYPTTANWSYWQSDTFMENTVITDAAEVADMSTASNARHYSHNHDNTAGNHKIFTDGGLISSATDQRHTASGISWKMQPTSTTRTTTYPLYLSLAKVAVAANSLVTIKAWMRRDNSGLTMRLVCKGGQIAGVASDVTASVTTTNAWEEETITFTPTEAGVVEITAEAFGGSAFSGWVDDMTISQA